jgi:hypothetical protein
MESMSKLKAGILFLLNSFLILSLNIKIFPELFIFPWLVSKGLLPYRDFFDHHGPLIYYLLAPFSFDKSLTLIKFIYFVLQTIILFLFLKIIRSQTKHYFILELLFVLVNFFMSENVFWFENLTTLIFLLIYFLSLKKTFLGQDLILALLIWSASLIKPHAALILLPVFLLLKNRQIIIYCLGLWMITIGYFFLQKALPFFIDNLLSFNFFCASYFTKEPLQLFDTNFLKFSLLLFLFCLLVNIFNRNTKNNLFLLSFIVIAFLFFFPRYSKTHTSVMIPFFVIFLGKSLEIKDKLLKPILIFLTIIYFLYTAKLVINHYFYLQKQPLEHYGKIEKLFHTDQLPTTRFVLDFPWVKQYYKL